MKKWAPYYLLLPFILLMSLFLMGLCTGITQSFGVVPVFGLTKPTVRYYIEILTHKDLVASIVYSLKIAMVSSIFAIILGSIICLFLVYRERDNKDEMSITERILKLPVITPHVVTAVFAINLFSNNGQLARLFFHLGMIQNQNQFPTLIHDRQGIGIVLAYVWKEAPFIVFFVLSLMKNINGKLGEVARNLGASGIQTMWRVTLPLCKESILSAWMIIFVFAFGGYELPFLLGATWPRALPVLAYQEFTTPDLQHRPYAMAINGLILFLSIVCTVGYFYLMKKSMEEDEK
jgi:hypothetical protein